MLLEFMFDYAGAVHIHSKYSYDGNTSVEEIIKAAQRAGLDFIIISDHFRLDAKNAGWEGWHDNVFVLVGEEISPRYNHCVAVGIDKPIIAWRKSSKPQDYIDEVNRQGGLALIAHPDHTGAPKFGVNNYPWTDWTVKNYAAVSIWDLMTDWQEKLYSFGAALFSFVFPGFVLSGPKAETLARWDAMNSDFRSKVAGYGEVDNHNSLKRYFGFNFRIFPFDLSFSTIRTHVLLGEPLNRDVPAARKQLMNAIKSARLYVAQEKWNKAKGFLFRIYDTAGTAFTGEELKLTDKPVRLEARIPKQGRLIVVRNGQVIEETRKMYVSIDIEKSGTYRIEAFQRKCGIYKPWIYSNPIWVI